MILDLVKHDDPILRQKCSPFNFDVPPEDPIQLAKDLTETMLAKGGIGLAANQVGKPYQVFVVKASPILAFFNPLIVDYSEESGELDEGCLSFPGLFCKVRRPEDIRIRYTEPNGNQQLKTFFGLTSRVIQHEYEHLYGGLFFASLSNLKKSIMIKKANKKGYKYFLKDVQP